jgi:hypothetical protein
LAAASASLVRRLISAVFGRARAGDDQRAHPDGRSQEETMPLAIGFAFFIGIVVLVLLAGRRQSLLKPEAGAPAMPAWHTRRPAHSHRCGG